MNCIKVNTKINLQDFSKSISQILANPKQKIPKYLEFLLKQKIANEQNETNKGEAQRNSKAHIKPIITEQQKFLSELPAAYSFNSPTQKQNQKQVKGVRLSLNSKEKNVMQEKKSEKKIMHQSNKSTSNYQTAINLVEEKSAQNKVKRKKKNNTAMSLDTADFQSLKKYFQYKENQIKQEKTFKKETDSKKHQRNQEEKYKFLEGKPTHKKKQSEDLSKNEKIKPIQGRKKGQVTITNINFKLKDQNLKTLNINLFEKSCITRKAIDLNLTNSKTSLNSNKTNQQFFSMTASSMKQPAKRNQQYTFTKNSNLKLNNYVEMNRDQSDLSIKTSSNKTVIKIVSQLTDTNSSTEQKKFNFNKESNNSYNQSNKDNQKQTEYDKLQDRLNQIENKILSVKTNIETNHQINNKELEGEFLPKTTTAIQSKILGFQQQQVDKKGQKNQSNDKKVGEISQTNDKNQLINLFKKVNQNLKQQQSKINVDSKDLQSIKLQNEKLTQYLNKIKQQQEQKKSQQSKQQKSKEFPEISQKSQETHHIRNHTAAVDSKLITKEEPPSICSIVTQVKLGQQFGQLPLTTASPQTCSPPSPEQSQHSQLNYSEEFIFGLQEIYYVGKLIESFILDLDDYFVLMFRDHFLQSLQTLHFLQCMDNKSKQSLENKSVRLGKKDSKKKTLVLDLDETLIHCNESLEMPSDIILPIQFPTGEKLQVGVNIRPFTQECLEELNNYYEIVIFTASHSCYANKVLDYLDPKNTLIKHRLFRENCVLAPDGFYVKDLSIFEDRDINEILLVDNAVYSFAFHLNNGIPILPFYDNPDDTELKDLTTYLIKLSQFEEITKINSFVFRLNDYHKYMNPVQLLETLYPAFLEDEEEEQQQQQQEQ